jgi:thiamine-phosphate pyrophosphorylase
MREIYRILDANFNRAREALRVAEDCGRFVLNDPAITQMAKNLRSDLQQILTSLPAAEMLVSRDTPGDIGTEITSPTESQRSGLTEVATAACKRLTEALRTIEEYGKFVSPREVLKIERMRYNAYTLEQRLMGKLMSNSGFAETKLYVLISSRLCKGSIRETARAAIAGGADVIQLREKEACDAEFLAMAAELRELTDETGKCFIINDRPDIAAIVAADGVHIGQGDLPVAEVRRLLRPGAIVGKSTHNIEQARGAINEGVDYISVGPMYPTSTKDAGPVAGTELLHKASMEFPLPIVPVGGINEKNLPKLVDAGAKRVAVCSAVCAAKDPQAAAEKIRAALK